MKLNFLMRVTHLDLYLEHVVLSDQFDNIF